MTRTARLANGLIAAALAAFGAACGSACGLGIRDRITGVSGQVECCGGFAFRDVTLPGSHDPEFQLVNTAMPSKPGFVDAFLVPTSCGKLFDGAYPGASPLCQVYAGPTAPGKVSPRVKLAAGPYRLWLQGYTSNTTAAPHLVDIDIWNTSCTSLLQ